MNKLNQSQRGLQSIAENESIELLQLNFAFYLNHSITDWY